LPAVIYARKFISTIYTMMTPYTLRKKIAESLRHRHPQLSNEDLETIIIELFIEWHHCMGRSDSKNNFGEAWIMTSAKHRAIDFLRRRQSSPVLEHYDPMEEEYNAGQHIASHDLLPHIEEALNLLPFQQASLLYRYYIEGYSYEELSLLEGKSEASIKKQVQRILIRLRRLLDIPPPHKKICQK
jgi:RNA polymerase sigma factor (sigma-70 family)